MSTEVVRAACPHDCPDTCGMLVTVEDGVAVRIQGDASMPFTQGTLCTKVAHYLERTYSPDRVLYPQKRIGKKGEGRFARISWDEALDEIAARLKSIAAEDPQMILPCSYAGTMGMLQYSSMDRRFFHRLGASLLDRTLCSSAGKAGLKATLGGSYGMDPEQFVDSRLILIWGSNPIVSNLHFWSRAQEAKRRGAKLVAIDPYRSLTAEKCQQHIALFPGTDAALALGMMHVLIAEDLIDRDYLARHTIGFEGLRKRVLAEYAPADVAAICGLRVEEVVELAREYGRLKPAGIRLNYGMQRHAGGGMAARTIACLPALTGGWRHPAGGIVLTTADFYGFDHAALERPDLIPRGRPPRIINHAALGDALTSASPPVKATIVYNNNPVAVCPESSKVIAGFSREDLFTVVMDSFLTDTADYADIVLPATTQLEHLDVHKSYGHLYVLANNAAIAPVGESLPNIEVFRRLAARMGFDESCFRDDDEAVARQALASGHPNLRGIEWPMLREKGWMRLAVPEKFAPFAEGNFATPSGKCELYSESLEKQGMDPLPFYNPPAELASSNPVLARRYPLSFLSPPRRNFLNSSFANLPRFRENDRPPEVELHPDDAASRGVADGDPVRVFNDRGWFGAVARVNGKPRRGVAVALSVWWKKFSPDGRNANDVTSQRIADLGGAATFYDCLVEVEKAA
ncbi:MAG TPA: molybdopterin oxidoreductase family protein [Burkholderiales bacterium]|nr:molybdopterin oxidoreductase family protein [Burkholderiales bacterium]